MLHAKLICNIIWSHSVTEQLCYTNINFDKDYTGKHGDNGIFNGIAIIYILFQKCVFLRKNLNVYTVRILSHFAMYRLVWLNSAVTTHHEQS